MSLCRQSVRIYTRIQQYLPDRPGTQNWYNTCAAGSEHPSLYKRTTACQIRAGIEHLFKKHQPSPELGDKLRHFSLAWVEETCFAERFYAEDLAIGTFRPWFNLDCER